MSDRNLVETDLDHFLNIARERMENLRGARIFMTGGTGFVGKWLLDTLLHANQRLRLNAKVVVLSRTPASFAMTHARLANDAALSFVQGDVRTFSLPAGEISHVVHAATNVATDTPPIEMFDTVVNGTHRVLRAARDACAEHVLLVSSGAVYGKQPAALTHVDESYPGTPLLAGAPDAYAQGKRAAEWLSSSGVTEGYPSARIARCFAFVGPYLPLSGRLAVGNFLQDRMAQRAISVSGDGTPLRSYLYASDLAWWLWTILVDGTPGQAYNVGSEDALSIAELAHRVATLEGGSCSVSIGQRPAPDVPPLRYVPCTRKARELLGLSTTVPLDEGLSRTLQWLKQSTAIQNPS